MDSSPLFPLARPSRSVDSIPRVYLAGAIEKAPDGGVAWRRDLTDFLTADLGHVVLDPTLHERPVLTEEERQHFRTWKTDTGRWSHFQDAVRRIIHRDAGLILTSTDYVIAYWDDGVLGGGGTHGELTLAFLHGIPVFLVLGMPRESVSSWILGCSEEVFDTFQALKGRLKTLAKEGRLGLNLSPLGRQGPPQPPKDPGEIP